MSYFVGVLAFVVCIDADIFTVSAQVLLTASLADDLIKQQCLRRPCGFTGITFITPCASPRISVSSAGGL